MFGADCRQRSITLGYYCTGMGSILIGQFFNNNNNKGYILEFVISRLFRRKIILIFIHPEILCHSFSGSSAGFFFDTNIEASLAGGCFFLPAEEAFDGFSSSLSTPSLISASEESSSFDDP